MSIAKEDPDGGCSPMSLSTAERATVRPASASGLRLAAPKYMRAQRSHEGDSTLGTTGPRADGCSAGLFGQFCQMSGLKTLNLHLP